MISSLSIVRAVYSTDHLYMKGSWPWISIRYGCYRKSKTYKKIHSVNADWTPIMYEASWLTVYSSTASFKLTSFKDHVSQGYLVILIRWWLPGHRKLFLQHGNFSSRMIYFSLPFIKSCLKKVDNGGKKVGNDDEYNKMSIIQHLKYILLIEYIWFPLEWVNSTLNYICSSILQLLRHFYVRAPI